MENARFFSIKKIGKTMKISWANQGEPITKIFRSEKKKINISMAKWNLFSLEFSRYICINLSIQVDGPSRRMGQLQGKCAEEDIDGSSNDVYEDVLPIRGVRCAT